MSNHSGFAAVAQIRNTAINSTLAIYHRSGLVPTRVNVSRSWSNPFGSGQVVVAFDLFLDSPHLVFQESQNAVLAKLVLAGTVVLDGNGISSRERLVRFNVDIRFLPQALAANGVTVRLQAAGATLVSFEAESVGAPIPSAVMDFLNGNDVRTFLSAQLINAVAAINSISPPLLVPFIDSIGVGTLVNVSRVATKVMSDGIAVALDFSSGEMDFQTNGTLNDIESFLSVSDLAICAHPSVRRLLARQGLPEVRRLAAEHDVTVDSLSIKLAENHLKIKIEARKDEFSATLNMRAIVHIGSPEAIEEYEDEYGQQYVQITPGTDDIWVEIWDIDIDADLPWWVYVLVTAGVFILFPMGPAIIAAIVSAIDTIKANVANQIQSPETGASRVQRVTLPGTTSPFVDFTVSQIKTSPGGFQTRAWFRPVTIQNAAKVIGPTNVTVEELIGGAVSYTMTEDIWLWHPDNPLVEVRWQVRRSDTNKVLASRWRDLSEPDALNFAIDLGADEHIGSSKYSINCSVFQKGSPKELLASHTVQLTVEDRLDRTHPFVQWDHQACVPRVERVQGILRQTGWDYVERSSKIHKTKLPGRCRMAGQYSPQTWPISLHYSDSLPFPADQLSEHREMLCDYCFFGGPDKETPLPL